MLQKLSAFGKYFNNLWFMNDPLEMTTRHRHRQDLQGKQQPPNNTITHYSGRNNTTDRPFLPSAKQSWRKISKQQQKSTVKQRTTTAAWHQDKLQQLRCLWAQHSISHIIHSCLLLLSAHNAEQSTHHTHAHGSYETNPKILTSNGNKYVLPQGLNWSPLLYILKSAICICFN